MNLIDCGRNSLAVRVVITGATGFIGNALTKRLNQDGVHVEGLSSEDGDIANIDLDVRLANNKPDYVIHLAGRTFVPASWKDPFDFYRVNVLGTLNVAEYCRRHGISLIYLSAYVYGSTVSLPIREDSFVKPNNPYALSKFLGEEVCRQYSEAFGLSVVIFRPFNVYGPGQSKSFLIPTIINQVLNNDVVELDSLEPRRDYIYIDDLTDVIALSLKSSLVARIYNIGSGYSMSVLDVVQTILLKAGVNKSVISRNIKRENEVMDVVADISRLNDELGWSPKFKLADGVDAILNSH